MQEIEPDEESFPLLRPDLIPALSTAWLLRSKEELDPLLDAWEDDASGGSLLHYALQQRALVDAELSRREASSRLARMFEDEVPSPPPFMNQLSVGDSAPSADILFSTCGEGQPIVAGRRRGVAPSSRVSPSSTSRDNSDDSLSLSSVSKTPAASRAAESLWKPAVAIASPGGGMSALDLHQYKLDTALGLSIAAGTATLPRGNVRTHDSVRVTSRTRTQRGGPADSGSGAVHDRLSSRSSSESKHKLSASASSPLLSLTAYAKGSLSDSSSSVRPLRVSTGPAPSTTSTVISGQTTAAEKAAVKEFVVAASDTSCGRRKKRTWELGDQKRSEAANAKAADAVAEKERAEADAKKAARRQQLLAEYEQKQRLGEKSASMISASGTPLAKRSLSANEASKSAALTSISAGKRHAVVSSGKQVALAVEKPNKLTPAPMHGRRAGGVLPQCRNGDNLLHAAATIAVSDLDPTRDIEPALLLSSTRKIPVTAASTGAVGRVVDFVNGEKTGSSELNRKQYPMVVINAVPATHAKNTWDSETMFDSTSVIFRHATVAESSVTVVSSCASESHVVTGTREAFPEKHHLRNVAISPGTLIDVLPVAATRTRIDNEAPVVALLPVSVNSSLPSTGDARQPVHGHHADDKSSSLADDQANTLAGNALNNSLEETHIQQASPDSSESAISVEHNHFGEIKITKVSVVPPAVSQLEHSSKEDFDVLLDTSSKETKNAAAAAATSETTVATQGKPLLMSSSCIHFAPASSDGTSAHVASGKPPKHPQIHRSQKEIDDVHKDNASFFQGSARLDVLRDACFEQHAMSTEIVVAGWPPFSHHLEAVSTQDDNDERVGVSVPAEAIASLAIHDVVGNPERGINFSIATNVVDEPFIRVSTTTVDATTDTARNGEPFNEHGGGLTSRPSFSAKTNCEPTATGASSEVANPESVTTGVNAGTSSSRECPTPIAAHAGALSSGAGSSGHVVPAPLPVIDAAEPSQRAESTFPALPSEPVSTAVPVPAAAPPLSYSAAFPDCRSMFTGCLASSLAPAFAGGGMSAAAARLRTAAAATGDSAVTPEAAAAAVVRTMRAFLEGAPERALTRAEAEEAAPRAARAAAVSSSPLRARPAAATVDDYDDDDDDDDADDAAVDTDQAAPAAASSRYTSEDGSAATAAAAGLGPQAPLGTAAACAAVPPSQVRYVRIASAHREVTAVVRHALAADPRWREVPPGFGNAPVWELMWAWGKPPVQRNHLLTWQRVNHFRQAKELTRKDLLKKNLARYACLGARMAAAYALQPPTFVLPKEYLQFAEEFGRAAAAAAGAAGGVADSVVAAAAAAGAALGGGRGFVAAPGRAPSPASSAAGADSMSKLLLAMGAVDASAAAAAAAATPATTVPAPPPNLWIMKPVGLSRGRGISVVSDIGQVRCAADGSAVVQRYVADPLLLHGHKFDLRLYVLVTSFAPLEAFLYRRGFARVSARRFSAAAASAGDRFMHLTNSSVQRHDAGAVAAVAALPGADAGGVGGTKCSLEFLWSALRAEAGVDTDALWGSIAELVVKSLVCVDDVIPAQPNSFEVFGYDVLIDRQLRPWLLEVNASPSLGVDSPMDLLTKTQLIADTVALVDPLPIDRAALVRTLDRRLHGGGGVGTGFWSPPVPPSANGGGGGGGGGGGRPRDRPSGGANGGGERAQLDADLGAILHGRAPRVFGAPPPHMGQYQRICPGSDAFLRAMKLKLMNFRPARTAKTAAATSSSS